MGTQKRMYALSPLINFVWKKDLFNGGADETV
jgi:hypothetical protein